MNQLLNFFTNRGNADSQSTGRLTPTAYQKEFIAAAQDHILIDVRTAEEFAGGHIKGAVNIPLQKLAQQLRQVPKTKPVVLYCRSGARSANAAQLLRKAEYPQIYDLGGIMSWQSQGLPVE